MKDKMLFAFFLTKLCVLCALCGICFFGVVDPAFAANGDMVEVVGQADIEAGKKDIARGRALNDAFHRAVEQVVGIMVEAETLVKNFELLNDRVYSKTSGYIEKYKVLEEKVEGDTLKVKIEAKVSMGYLEKDLGSLGVLMKSVGKPRLLLLISEQNIVNEKSRNWWTGGDQVSIGVVENTLMQKFMEKGFDFVDRQVVLQGLKEDPSLARGAGEAMSNETALRLASEGAAEVVIIGQAVAKAGQPIMGMSMRSCQATISARVLNADSGEPLASATASGVSAHIDAITGGTDALKKAAVEMSDKLISQIIAKWKKRVSGTHTVKLVITGLDYDKIAWFKDFVREQVGGVANVYDRSYNEGTARFDVEVKGNARTIADKICSKEFSKGVIEVISLTGNVIKLKIGKK